MFVPPLGVKRIVIMTSKAKGLSISLWTTVITYFYNLFLHKCLDTSIYCHAINVANHSTFELVEGFYPLSGSVSPPKANSHPNPWSGLVAVGPAFPSSKILIKFLSLTLFCWRMFSYSRITLSMWNECFQSHNNCNII